MVKFNTGHLCLLCRPHRGSALLGKWVRRHSVASTSRRLHRWMHRSMHGVPWVISTLAQGSGATKRLKNTVVDLTKYNYITSTFLLVQVYISFIFCLVYTYSAVVVKNLLGGFLFGTCRTKHVVLTIYYHQIETLHKAIFKLFKILYSIKNFQQAYIFYICVLLICQSYWTFTFNCAYNVLMYFVCNPAI